MVATGTFREDLWYRIATFPVFLPPLRERIEDLRPLADHFARRSAIRFGLAVCVPTDQDIALLATYAWPGNIRELGTVIDRAALLGNGERLEIARALGWSGSMGDVRRDHPAEPEVRAPERAWALNHVITEHITAALRHTRGRIEGPRGAAALLAINPNTLRAKMRKLGIAWGRFRE
jgi:DNA-binding NtrC family response regulator